MYFSITGSPDPNLALGHCIRQMRKDAGYTLTELAAFSQVGVRFLSELENGKRSVRMELVFRVIAALGLHMAIGDEPLPDTAEPGRQG